MTKTILFLLSVLFFAAIHLSAQPPGDKKKEKSSPCRPNKSFLPLKVRDNVSLVTVFVNEKPRTFLVDPAGKTIINSDRLRLPQMRQLRAGVIGAGGVAALDWDIVSVDRLRLGSTQFQQMQILARTLAPLERQIGEQIDGILGTDVLMMWGKVSMDFEQNILVLELRTPCNGKNFTAISSASANENASPWNYQELRTHERNSPHH